ncbi:zinc finger Ran-binding domain-containing protein 2-like [Ananas comosus]|uniref:Zinc finger Ran-binding domain-containing protein 2-like n=1 Tax=Ananas comosus TaxID=4615 RepID=A0A6P5G5W9_ANACO|nr:zinc finger Ran-binding domain-containing protein 2-like [Ananas comosus]
MNRKPGDWNCMSCNHLNFSRRDSCQRCHEQRPPAASGANSSFGFGSGGGYAPRTRARAGWKFGDWICTRPGCNKHNFASRTECFGCNAPREPVAGKET